MKTQTLSKLAKPGLAIAITIAAGTYLLATPASGPPPNTLGESGSKPAVEPVVDKPKRRPERRDQASTKVNRPRPTVAPPKPRDRGRPIRNRSAKPVRLLPAG